MDFYSICSGDSSSAPPIFQVLTDLLSGTAHVRCTVASGVEEKKENLAARVDADVGSTLEPQVWVQRFEQIGDPRRHGDTLCPSFFCWLLASGQGSRNSALKRMVVLASVVCRNLPSICSFSSKGLSRHQLLLVTGSLAIGGPVRSSCYAL